MRLALIGLEVGDTLIRLAQLVVSLNQDLPQILEILVSPFKHLARQRPAVIPKPVYSGSEWATHIPELLNLCFDFGSLGHPLVIDHLELFLVVVDFAVKFTIELVNLPVPAVKVELSGSKLVLELIQLLDLVSIVTVCHDELERTSSSSSSSAP